MISRVLLALAFGLGASAALAQNPQAKPADVLSITVDQAKVAKLPAGTSTLIIGNPMVADVTMLKQNGAMVVTGKGYGETNLIAIDNQGEILDEKQIRVVPTSSVLVVQRGNARASYSCRPACVPTVQLGDENTAFTEAGTQITTRNTLAQGGGAAAAK